MGRNSENPVLVWLAAVSQYQYRGLALPVMRYSAHPVSLAIATETSVLLHRFNRAELVRHQCSIIITPIPNEYLEIGIIA
jgi:hypothetical protein